MSKNERKRKTVKLVKNKRDAKVAAVIEIGVNDIRLKIGQSVKKTVGESSVKILEDMEYPLGLDCSKINFEKTELCCEVMKNYLKVCKEYGAHNIKVVASAAFRQATNISYVLDQIAVRTGVSVKILDIREEEEYIYRSVCKSARNCESGLIAYINRGSLGVAEISNGYITENISLGSLKVRELFKLAEEYGHTLAEEYFQSYLKSVGRLTGCTESFAAWGIGGVDICRLTCAKKTENGFLAEKTAILNLYGEIRHMTAEEVSEKYGIEVERAPFVSAAVCIYANFLELIKSETVIIYTSSLADSLLYEILAPSEYRLLDKDFEKNALYSARKISRRYFCDEKHQNAVEKYALTMFDKLKKRYGLTQKDKLLLQIMCILKGVGKFVGDDESLSGQIIKNQSIIGLSRRDTETVAYGCGSGSVYDVKVGKLKAVLEIAEALDAGYKQKIDGIEVKIKDGKMLISVSGQKNTEFEEWCFSKRCPTFEEVYGIKAVLIKKAVL